MQFELLSRAAVSPEHILLHTRGITIFSVRPPNSSRMRQTEAVQHLFFSFTTVQAFPKVLLTLPRYTKFKNLIINKAAIITLKPVHIKIVQIYRQTVYFSARNTAKGLFAGSQSPSYSFRQMSFLLRYSDQMLYVSTVCHSLQPVPLFFTVI